MSHPAVRALLSRGDPGTTPQRQVIDGTELVSYSSTRVFMKREAWEMLSPTGILVQWIRPTAEAPWAIALTHGELLDVFGEVMESVSWEEARCYHFPNVPTAAESFRVVGMEGAPTTRSTERAVHRTERGKRPPRHYALLCHAATYDVQGASMALPDGTWVLPSGDAAPGDTLVFWRTRGADGKRGVVALGQVTHAPELLEGGHPADRYWLRPPPVGLQRRIRFRFLPAPGFPLWLGEGPADVLEKLSVSRAQGNKLYTVPGPVWDKLLELAGGSGPEHVEVPNPPPVEPLAAEPAPSVTLSIEEVAEQVLAHLRTYGSLTELEVTNMAGSARGYRKLRRHLDGTGAPLRIEVTPRGTLWRLGREDP